MAFYTRLWFAGSGASECETSAQEVPQTPSARGGVDLPTRADSNGSRRHDGVLCQPLANRFSNLPDVELRPGTAACHAFGGDADSCEHGPRSSRLSNHDPAFSVTHVSLADMAPNLFTAKDHEPVSSTPRCQRSTASSSAAVRRLTHTFDLRRMSKGPVCQKIHAWLNVFQTRFGLGGP